MRGRRRYLRDLLGTGVLVLGSGCNDGGGGTSGAGGGPGPVGTPTEPLTVPDSLPSPTLGDADASVVVDVYEDFACPKCVTYHEETFGKLRERYIVPGTINYVYHDYPKVSQRSWALAGAARAVQHDAGEAAFWTFADEIYAGALTGAGPAAIGRRAAGTVGADARFVARVVESDAFRPFLERQVEAARDAGAPFVPSTFVNGTFTMPNYGALSTVIDAELESS